MLVPFDMTKSYPDMFITMVTLVFSDNSYSDILIKITDKDISAVRNRTFLLPFSIHFQIQHDDLT